MVSNGEIIFALSCGTRRAILAMAQPNMTLAETASLVGVRPQTLTRHLEILEDAGLLVVSRDGFRKYIRVKFAEVRIPLRGKDPRGEGTLGSGPT